MNQINKNRLVGGGIIVFAALLFVPAILTPKERDLSNPNLAVNIDDASTSDTVIVASNTAQPNADLSQDVVIPPPPTLQLESVTNDATVPVVGQPANKTAPEKLVSVALSQKTPSEAPVIKPASASSSWLRVGSFSSTENANRLLKQLKPKYSAKVEKININGNTYHRVLVGPYNDENALQEAKKILMTGGYKPSIQR